MIGRVGVLVATLPERNELRPIVWVEKQEANSSLCISIQTRFSAVEKPMLHTSQLMLPLQAQQLGRSYNGRLLVHLEIVVKQTVAAGETPRPVSSRQRGKWFSSFQRTFTTCASARCQCWSDPVSATVPRGLCPATSLCFWAPRWRATNS